MALVVSLPVGALAQEGDAGAGEAPPAEAAPADETLETSRNEGVRRGLFVTLDPGTYLTFGGRNTNDPTLPTKTVSNLQPYVGLTLGYDVLTGDLFNLGVGLKLAAGFNSGAGRVSNADLALGAEVLTTRPNDFAVYEIDLALHLGFMVASRWAMNVKLYGGVGFVYPDPTKSATEVGASNAAIGGAFGGCAGVEYFTLINDFSVGLDACFEGALAGGLIPGVSGRIPIKYTF